MRVPPQHGLPSKKDGRNHLGLRCNAVRGHQLMALITSNILCALQSNASRGVSSAGTNGKLTWLPTDESGPGCEFETVRNIAPQTGLQSQFISGAGCGVQIAPLDETVIFADVPSPSLLRHLLKVEGGAAE